MATVRRFEELEIWQLARKQSKALDPFLKEGELSLNYALRNQLDNSSGSVMDNIAEGFDRFSRAEFRQFLVIARGSNAEVRSQLYRALDKKYLSEDQVTPLLKASVNIAVKISNFVSYLDRSGYRTKPQSGVTGDAQEPGIPYQGETDSYDFPREFLISKPSPKP